MASKTDVADADVDYESDPEDSPLPSMRRRAAASDDEEGSDGGEDKRKKSAARVDRSDDELNGQGGVEVYGDDDYDDENEELEEEEDYDELGEELEEEESREVTETRGQDNRDGNDEQNGEEANKQGEKKENEPYAVPTTGAFYMHDDRFQENGRGGRRRRMQGGGRKIWNAKEEGAWVHDRFEEMTLHETRHDAERRRGRGRGGFRGGRGRGGGPRRGRGGSRSYYNNENQNQNHASRSARGRGSRRYEPVNRTNSRNPPTQDKQMMQRNQESGPTSGNMRQQQSSSHGQSLNPKPQQMASFVPKRNIVSSSLNYASPPFYPSNSSNQDNQSDTRAKPALNSSNNDNANTNISHSRVVNVNLNANKSQFIKASSQVATSVVQQRAVSQVQPGSGGMSLGEDGSGGPMSNKTKGKQSGLMYGGPVSVPPGEQGFAGTPALLPVMQFSGQHPGAPALGMAVPGYVANSQLGFGNSAWVIAGATGSYPYVSGYYNDNNTQPSSQASSSAPSKEISSAKLPEAIKSSQKQEVSTEEPGQRQNKPRRYSEMNFGQ